MPRWADLKGAGLAAALIAAAGPAPAQTVDELSQRLTAFESEVRRLTAEVERLRFEARRDREALEARLQDFEYRIIELEGGDPTEAFRSPPPEVEPTPPAAGPGAPPAPLGALSLTVSEAERAAFEAATRDLRAVGPDAGRRGYDAFLTEHPGSMLGGEAMNRLGRAFADVGRHQEAARAFLRGLRDHGEQPFAPENMLGLGRSLLAIGDTRQACATFAAFDARYPDADPATRAEVAAARAAACG